MPAPAFKMQLDQPLYLCRSDLKLGALKMNASGTNPSNRNTDLRRLVDEAHPPRAADLNELHGLQKTTKPREGACGCL